MAPGIKDMPWNRYESQHCVWLNSFWTLRGDLKYDPHTLSPRYFNAEAYICLAHKLTSATLSLRDSPGTNSLNSLQEIIEN